MMAVGKNHITATLAALSLFLHSYALRRPPAPTLADVRIVFPPGIASHRIIGGGGISIKLRGPGPAAAPNPQPNTMATSGISIRLKGHALTPQKKMAAAQKAQM